MTIRWSGTCRALSAYAAPLLRPRSLRAAIARSVWYPTRIPSLTMSQCCPATPSSSQPTLARPQSVSRSPVTFMTGEPYWKVPSLSNVAKEVPAYAAS